MSLRTPNIIWIVTTQWRSSALGFAGDPNARTPCLDALAAESINYSQTVTPHPFGPFARAAMFTGVPSPRNGVRDYFDPLPSDARTIAHTLNRRGYTTAFFGKWHLGLRSRSLPLVGEGHAKTLVPPEARGGFALWEGFESGYLLNDPWLHGSRLPVPVKVPGYQSAVLCDRARAWFEDEIGQGSPRLFCVVSLEPPHPPYAAPSDGVEALSPNKLMLRTNVPQGGEAEAKARQELAGYYAHIEATDRAIGRLVGALPRANTVVVFTSVHGDMHGSHGLFRKGWPYEESVRVPLLVRLPDRHARTDDRPISLLDLKAMTAKWADGGEPALGRRTHAEISMPSVVALPYQCDRIWRGVRNRARKLVLNADGSPWLLFDLENDPDEMENLAGQPRWNAELAKLRRWVS